MSGTNPIFWLTFPQFFIQCLFGKAPISLLKNKQLSLKMQEQGQRFVVQRDQQRWSGM
jgi:hypothetical protein